MREEERMTRLFVDKLCERLAIEEAAVKLYESILQRIEDPDVARRLERFQREEAQHRDLLAAYLDKLDISAEERDTPSARLARHEGEALLSLVAEAETASQLLQVVLTLELMDETGWELLINLGRDTGDDQLVATFERCLRDEKDQLRQIRGMVSEDARRTVGELEKNLQF
jgi:rubrerythrin